MTNLCQTYSSIRTTLALPLRYVAMALLLLITGVGQMWAENGTITVYFKNTIGWME